jgi:hypothetical protein
MIILVTLLAGCGQKNQRLRQDQIIDITWEHLQPITSSQERENWRVVDAARVYGRSVVDQFSGLLISTCPGPSMPENGAIRSGSEYWFVKVAPRNEKEPPTQPVQAAMTEAITPEPLFREALFLIDPISGEVVARRLTCR